MGVVRQGQVRAGRGGQGQGCHKPAKLSGPGAERISQDNPIDGIISHPLVFLVLRAPAGRGIGIGIGGKTVTPVQVGTTKRAW